MSTISLMHVHTILRRKKNSRHSHLVWSMFLINIYHNDHFTGTWVGRICYYYLKRSWPCMSNTVLVVVSWFTFIKAKLIVHNATIIINFKFLLVLHSVMSKNFTVNKPDNSQVQGLVQNPFSLASESTEPPTHQHNSLNLINKFKL